MSIIHALRLPGFRDFVEDFLLVVERDGKSMNTVAAYRQNLVDFWKFLCANELPTDPAAIEEKHITLFMVARRRQGITNSTLALAVTTFKVFFKWLCEQGYVETSPVAKVKRPKAEQKPIEIFSAEQIAQMIDVWPQGDPLGERNRAILLLMYDTGLRNFEVCSLRATSDCINLQSREITVVGKGKKTRMVAISERTRAQLWRYLSHYRNDRLGEDWLFTTERGGQLSSETLYYIVRQSGRKAGIQGVRCSPHTIRHSFATQMAPEVDTHDLQMLLGHANIQTTAKYVHPHVKDVVARHKKKVLGDKLQLKKR